MYFLQFHMGNCAEDTAKKYDISRLEQDEYAKRSYMNSARASEDGTLSREIVSVSVPQKKGKPDVVVKNDEEYLRYTVHNITYDVATDNFYQKVTQS